MSSAHGSRHSHSRGDRRSSFADPPPFIGRDAEFAWLERLLQEAVEGRPHVAFVSGEPGIGKTRLIRELRREAQRAGVRVLYGRCHEELELPYAPLEPLLELLGCDVGEGGAAAGEPAGRPADGARDGGGRRRLFQSIAERTFQSAREWALLLVIEDLHWADGASRELLSHLCFAAADAAQGQPVPLLVVCTLLPPEPGDALAELRARLAREDIFHAIDLTGLGVDEVDELTRALGIPAPPRHLVLRLVQTTEGNPLFLEEVVRHLVRTGAFERRGEGWVPIADPADIELPPHVSLAIQSNLRGLAEDTLEILGAAALLDSAFDAAGLAAITGAAPAAVEAAIQQALAARILRQAGRELRFAHSLLRRALAGRLGSARRAALHRRIAERLEERHAGAPEAHLAEIAHHWMHADHRGDEARAIATARRAGDRAFEDLAHTEAARHYEAALSLDEIAHVLAPRERGELHQRAALACFREMDPDSCLSHCERAEEVYRRDGDWGGVARALMLRARTEYTLAPLPVGSLIDLAPLEECLARLGDAAPELRCEIEGVLSEAYNFARQPARAEEVARSGLLRARQAGDARLCAWLELAVGSAQLNRLAIPEALASWERTLADARRSGDVWTIGLPLHRIPLALASLGRFDRAERHLREAEATARRTGDWGDHSIAQGASAAIALGRGELWRVEERARATLRAVRRTGYPWGGVMALIALCGARALRGAWDEARDATERLEAPGELFAQPGPDLRFMAALMRLRLGALSGCPAPASAEQLENYLKVLEASGLDLGTLSGFCSCLEVGAFLGRPDLGARGGAAIRRAVGEELVFTQGCEFLLPRVLGLGAALRDDWGEAEAHFERASRIAREIGAAPELARTHLDLAAMLVRRGAQGDRERAARGVEEAAASIRAIGLRGLERRAAELARALGLPEDASAPAPADPERLGEGERQLLECVARGRSDAEICDHLLVGPATLAGSLRALFEKLGVESRVEATAWAFERGIGLPSGAEERLRGVGRPRVRAHLPRAGLRAGQPVAIFVSDIESSTALIQRLGDARARELVHAHNRIARTCLREHAGFEIQHTGDGFIFSFASAPAAVRCAVAFQRALERDRGEQGTGLRVRIGIHAGTSLPEEGRLFGLAMNTTARICSRCPTNEIVASEAARAACGGLPLRFEALGPAVLKGIEDPVLLHRVLWREATD